MYLFSTFFVLFAPLVVAAILEERQDLVCAQDNCLRAVNGTRRGPSHPVTAQLNCRDYMTTTVIIDPILTTTTVTTSSSLTVVPPCPTFPTGTGGLRARDTPAAKLHKIGALEGRQDITSGAATKAGPVPYYATAACTLDRYSSACRCIGVTSGLVTSSSVLVTQTYTTTVVSTSYGACSAPAPTNGTTSRPGTSTTYTITMTHNSTTSTTTVVISSDTTRTGTGTGTGSHSHSTGTSIPSTSSDFSTTLPTLPPSPTPPFTNSTISFTTSFSLTSSSAPFPNTTLPSTTLPPTNTTLLPTTLPPTNTTLPSTTLPSTNTTLPSTTLPPTNTTLPSTTLPSTNITVPPTTFPANTSVPITLPPTNSTLSLTPVFPTNTTTSPTSTPTPCGGRGVRLCSGTCVDTTNDVQHCGTCNNACNPGYQCTNGVCTRPACDSDCQFSRLCGLSSQNTTCACGLDSANAQVCYNRDFDCNAGEPDQCDTTAECDVGSVCVLNACCGVRGGRCISTEGCGEQGASMELGERVAFGGMGKRSVRLF
ncbi:hypothetical protein P280DRAFT_269413 [Massarina eburnea CBS 473.64]|uniref:Uncharacterized protein n=1 Tax=Massarina eburnea CBS 473.64 TaxID=1395130 RepID=A0A6A6S4S9_9PLEO|nr:hypothetical protein P280DRAFT_269413 [Massarina eburnea CBS 473.64]